MAEFQGRGSFVSYLEHVAILLAGLALPLFVEKGRMQRFGLVVANDLDVLHQALPVEDVPQGDMLQSNDLRIGGALRQPKESNSLACADQIAAQHYLIIRQKKLFNLVRVHRSLVVRTSEKEGFGRQAVVVRHHRRSGQDYVLANSAADTDLVRVILVLEVRAHQSNCWSFDFLRKKMGRRIYFVLDRDLHSELNDYIYLKRYQLFTRKQSDSKTSFLRFSGSLQAHCPLLEVFLLSFLPFAEIFPFNRFLAKISNDKFFQHY